MQKNFDLRKFVAAYKNYLVNSRLNVKQTYSNIRCITKIMVLAATAVPKLLIIVGLMGGLPPPDAAETLLEWPSNNSIARVKEDLCAIVAKL